MNNREIAAELQILASQLVSIKMQAREVNAAIAVVECSNRLIELAEKIQMRGESVEDHNQQRE